MSSRGLAFVVALAALLTAAAGCAGRRAAEVEPPPQALLRWEARNETGIYGYLVFRAESPDGPFLRVSDEIIHAAADAEADAIGSYTWIDRDVVAGRTYYYTLDVVQNNGQKRRFSGVLSKTVAR